jgi:hypothetical protein
MAYPTVQALMGDIPPHRILTLTQGPARSRSLPP